MNTEASFVNSKEILEHIRMLTLGIGDYIVREERSDAVIADFIDDVRNLSGLLTTLSYVSVHEDLFALIKQI